MGRISKAYQILQLTCMLVTVIMLAGCKKDPVFSKEAAAVAAESPASAVIAAKPNPLEKYTELMRAVFGTRYNSTSGNAVVELPTLDDRSVTGRYLLTPGNMTVLPNGDAALVLNGEQADEAGNTSTYHAQPGLLSIYILRKDGTQWKVVRRYENIAGLGSSGNIGSTKWVTLADDKPGLAVEHGGIWQGYFISLLALFDLTAPEAEIRDLVDSEIRIVSDSTGACTEALDTCVTIVGNYHFPKGRDDAAYNDLQIDFSGEKAIARTDTQARDKNGDVLRIKKPISGMARYAFDGTSYKLVSGENMAPAF